MDDKLFRDEGSCDERLPLGSEQFAFVAGTPFPSNPAASAVMFSPLPYDVCMEASDQTSIAIESFWNPKKLNHDAARQEQRLYWSLKSVAERLAGATELTRNLYRMRGFDIDERKPDLTPRRVHRRQG